MLRLLRTTVLAGSLVLLLGALAAAQEWTRFRGPNGTGASQAKGIPVTWTEKDYNWKVEIPGVGHSSPVVWGERVFVMSADPDDATRYLLCYAADDGRELWRTEYKSSPHHLHDRSSFASCTPAVDAEQVYFAWSTPAETTLVALDHKGREQWKLDLGRWQSMHGFGQSPMLYEDLVILPNMQQAIKLNPGESPGESFLMAFDRKTGELRWKTPRKSVVANYSVPCIYQPPGGKPQLICASTGDGICGYDPATGRELWSYAKAFKLRTVSSPIVVGDVVIATDGEGAGNNSVVAVRPAAPDKPVYKITRAAPYVPTPIVKDDLVFLWSDKGIVTCIRGADGSEVWQHRVGGNNTGYSGSPVRVGDAIYCIDEDGNVMVIAAAEKFKLLGKNPLGEPSRSTPAISGGKMYLRTYSHLISLGGKST